MNNERNILFLCGRKQATSALRKAFAAREYKITFALSADEALEQIRQFVEQDKAFDVILATPDAQSKVRRVFENVYISHPDTVRVFVSNKENINSVAGLGNTNLLDKLFFSPVKSTAVVDVIENLIVQKKVLKEKLNYRKEVELLKQELHSVNANLELKVKEKAEQLVKAIYYDDLTGLPSRTLLKDRIEQAVKSAKRKNRKFALFMVGLDRFKYINDSLGQLAGDQVLVDVAGRLTKCVRSSDTVSRFGGDVFCLIAKDSDRVEDPGLVAKRILSAIAAPYRVNGQDVYLSCCVGIAIYPDNGQMAAHMMANAETAMRQAKMDGSNGFQYYSGEINQIAGQRLTLETELRQAIQREEFTLYYQPRIDMTSRRVVGVESSLRWQHPRRGLLSPMEFLPTLEETGMIEAVGEWVLAKAINALANWRKESVPDVMLAVNLSARQFHDKHLPALIGKYARKNRVDLQSNLLEIEITESLLMEDVIATRETLSRLHEMGIKVAIDDFGTGYSSLSYLTKFPLNYLKIDKSFVEKIHSSDEAKGVVEAIISLSYTLRLHVIAEGVETKDQLIALQALGCKQFQGYYFAKPMPEAEFIALMQKDAGLSIIADTPEDRLLQEPLLQTGANLRKH